MGDGPGRLPRSSRAAPFRLRRPAGPDDRTEQLAVGSRPGSEAETSPLRRPGTTRPGPGTHAPPDPRPTGSRPTAPPPPARPPAGPAPAARPTTPAPAAGRPVAPPPAGRPAAPPPAAARVTAVPRAAPPSLAAPAPVSPPVGQAAVRTTTVRTTTAGGAVAVAAVERPVTDAPRTPRRHRRTPDAPPPTAGTTGGGFRPEIQGLRALACTLVVIYHVWVGRVSGGVDVFFVITGFLLTGQFTRAAGRGTLDVVRSWGHTLRRIVPTTMVVLLGTLLAGMVLLPESRWSSTLADATAGATFVENWRLALESVDYYAAKNTASVVQHLWSLSIQAQVSLALPVVVLVAVALARRLEAELRPVMILVLSALTGASLVYSIYLTATAQQEAYFHTLTRVWEFGCGGLLALLVHRARAGQHLGVVLGWLGVVALVACGAVLDVEGGFPGYLALWPVLAAGLVIGVGTTGSPFGVDRFLAARPVQYLGDLSFALYLWHWPVLLYALVWADRPVAGLRGGALVIAVSLVLAVATHHLVEEPLRRAPVGRLVPRGDFRLVGVALVPVLLVCAVWQGTILYRSSDQGTVGDAEHPGASALSATGSLADVPEGALLPPTVAAYGDWFDYRTDCAAAPGHPDLESCRVVEPAGPPARRVVVIGDSHIQQLLPAIIPVAQERGWELTTLIRPGCPFSTGSDANVGEAACIEHNAAARAEVLETHPDAVIAQATRNVREGRTEETPADYVAAWREMDAAGIPVLAVRDNPRYGSWPAQCIEEYGRGASECVVPRDAFFGPTPPWASVDDLPPRVSFMDLTDHICTDRVCPPEIGNVLVNLDDNHLSASYSRTLAPAVRQRVTEVFGP